MASGWRATYRDRREAGRLLAARLGRYAGAADVTVLGLVRGGVPVAAEVASWLEAPLDVLVVRKLGVPGASEVAFGALGPQDVLVRNDAIADQVAPPAIDQVVARERAELERRLDRYRAGRPPLDLTGRTAVLVDDGLATGATARAAVAVARRLGAARVVLAAPVGAPEAVELVAEVADEVVCPVVPSGFGAVSRYFQRFDQVTDAEVVDLLTS